jgi:hypothetical protein
MIQLFRSMKEDAGNLPALGGSARTLGVRPGVDVPVTGPNAIVHPAQGGLSVSPNDPLNLPYFRRPPEFQGIGKDPVWSINDVELGPNLSYRPDPDNPGHGFVEPAQPMTLAKYQDALALTQSLWRKVGMGSATGSVSNGP